MDEMEREVWIEAIAYAIALEHVCPNNHVPTTQYETNTVSTLCRLIKSGIRQFIDAERKGESK